MKTIAIINLGYIGDVVNASPVCAELKKAYPDSEIIFITSPISIETAKCLPGVDETFAFARYGEHKGFKIFNLGFEIRKKYKIDAAIILTENFRSALLAFLIGAKKRYGRSCDGRDFLLTHKMPFLQEEKDLKVHVTEQYIRVLKLLLGEISEYKLSFNFFDTDKQAVINLLKQNGYKGEKIIGLCPITNFDSKSWDIINAAKFITEINKSTDYKVVIVGTKRSADFAEKLRVSGVTDFMDLSCKTSIPQLGALISLFDKFVTIDTGPMHIALALNIPTVCLFFQNNYKKWGPKDPSLHKLIYNESSIIKAEDVIKELNN